MMRFKMMSGDLLDITEEEVKNIQSKKGLVYVPTLNGFINLSSIESVLPACAVKNPNEGYLHDGTKVVKKFGIWVDTSNPDVKLDYNYYPELAKDEVYQENPKNKLEICKGTNIEIK